VPGEFDAVGALETGVRSLALAGVDV